MCSLVSSRLALECLGNRVLSGHLGCGMVADQQAARWMGMKVLKSWWWWVVVCLRALLMTYFLGGARITEAKKDESIFLCLDLTHFFSVVCLLVLYMFKLKNKSQK